MEECNIIGCEKTGRSVHIIAEIDLRLKLCDDHYVPTTDYFRKIAKLRQKKLVSGGILK